MRRSRHFEALDAWPAGELLEHDPRGLLDRLTRDKIQRALHSRRQLFEVMVDFWTDHFNIDPSKGDSRWLKPIDDRRVIRAHAMGRFAGLVRASALSPAMLWYLDGRENRKAGASARANENYARELLELHTLGVHGGCTQDDVMEVVRCLTGWTVRARSRARHVVGKVGFDASLHDDGEKRVLGTVIPAGLGKGDLDRPGGWRPARSGRPARALQLPRRAGADTAAAGSGRDAGKGLSGPRLRAHGLAEPRLKPEVRVAVAGIRSGPESPVIFSRRRVVRFVRRSTGKKGASPGFDGSSP